MKTRLILIILFLMGTILACKAVEKSRIYEDPAFSFQFPAGWQLMSELWDQHKLEESYYGLGTRELVMITSVRKRGESGAWFAVAAAPIPADSSLDEVFTRAYAPITGSLQDITQQTVNINGLPGLEMRYRRPWGEPWWQFRDIWLEKDGTAYLLSIHALNLDDYAADMEQILNSFALK